MSEIAPVYEGCALPVLIDRAQLRSRILMYLHCQNGDLQARTLLEECERALFQAELTIQHGQWQVMCSDTGMDV